MAGINRLGKGPAKPGTMRPADPNKYKTTDIFSEGTEGDKDYNRMVQDIEDTQQNHTGWLFGRGAFDKGDLLYLRDEEEKRRFTEQELREQELRSFAKMRQKVESAGDNSTFGAAPRSREGNGRASQLQVLASIVKVKPAANAKAKRPPDPVSPAKRAKQELKEEPGRPTIKREEAQEAEQGPVEAREEDGAGLAGLLGGYGSDSENDAETPPAQPVRMKREAGSLPLPSSLLADVKPHIKEENVEPEGQAEEEVDYEDSDGSDSDDDR